MPTFTFQEQGTVTLVLIALLPEERCCQSHPATELGRVCVGRLATYVQRDRVRCLELLRLELRLVVFDDDVKKKTWRRSSLASSGLWS